MSLGLRLKASLPEPIDASSLLQQTADWLLQTYAVLRPTFGYAENDGLTSLLCKLHPAAEEVEVKCVDSTHVIVSANTSTVGPGYHIFLSSILRNWAIEFNAVWEEESDPVEDYGDETGFFFSGDEEALRHEMYLWLSAVAHTFFDGSFKADDTGIALCMPINPRFETNQVAITQLGPRDQAWLAKTDEDGENGRDFFAWWDSGLTGDYYLNRALTHMWSNVRWRLPVNDAEREVLADTAHSLRSAYLLDTGLPFPWPEWNQILDLIDTNGEEREWLRPHEKLTPTIGYRRRNIRESLPGGWTINIPGAFSDFETDEEDNLCAVDSPREIWFTAYRSSEPVSPRAWKLKKGEVKAGFLEYIYEQDDWITKAKITSKQSDSGQTYFILKSSAICSNKRAVCTIVFSNNEDRSWALDTWRSIRPPDSDVAE